MVWHKKFGSAQTLDLWKDKALNRTYLKVRCKYSLTIFLKEISCKSPNNILRYYLYLKFISYLSFMVSLELLFLNFVNKTRNIFRRNNRFIWKKRGTCVTFDETKQKQSIIASSTLKVVRTWKGIVIFLFSNLRLSYRGTVANNSYHFWADLVIDGHV